MFVPDSPQRALWLFLYLANIVLVGCLWHSGLYRVYRFFFLYSALRVVQRAVLFPFEPNTNTYALIYLFSEPLFWLLYVLIVLELYGLVLRRHPGIATLGRWAITGGLFLSLLISVLTLFPDLSNPVQKFPVLLYFGVLQRAIMSALLVFLLLISGVLVWYPVPLTRNALVYCIGYAVYFLSTSLGALVRNVSGPTVTRTVNTIQLGIWSACVLIWILFLNRSGEAKTVVIGHLWQPSEAERLVGQLEAINSNILRTLRK
jgi:hypothetical protein